MHNKTTQAKFDHSNQKENSYRKEITMKENLLYVHSTNQMLNSDLTGYVSRVSTIYKVQKNWLSYSISYKIQQSFSCFKKK